MEMKLKKIIKIMTMKKYNELLKIENRYEIMLRENQKLVGNLRKKEKENEELKIVNNAFAKVIDQNALEIENLKKEKKEIKRKTTMILKKNGITLEKKETTKKGTKKKCEK